MSARLIDIVLAEFREAKPFGERTDPKLFSGSGGVEVFAAAFTMTGDDASDRFRGRAREIIARAARKLGDDLEWCAVDQTGALFFDEIASQCVEVRFRRFEPEAQ